MRTVRFLLTGLGNVGVPLLEILQSRASLLMERYRLELLPVGLADSGGAAVSPTGLDVAAVLAVKRARHSVASLPGVGRPGMSGRALVREVKADLLLEATPTNLKDGQPGLDITRDALMRGMPAVLASKGPLVLGFQELARLSDLESPGRPPLRFSGAAGAAMPLVSLGRGDLALGKLGRFEGVLNNTSQLLLSRMSQGHSYDSALKEAQALGIAEADPALDVDGWDTASKLVILANAVMRVPAVLSDVAVTGMRGVTREQLDTARAKGGQVLLLARGEPLGEERWEWSVRPTAVDASHPLARLGPMEMGAVFRSDLHGVNTLINAEQGARGTGAAMLKDVLEIFPD
ncbi:homoserine dehydrogenase [Corallococcus sp. Z5C101001]|nr:homoserine dehydrogenase [Corallococcus sp. Z5C101001]